MSPVLQIQRRMMTLGKVRLGEKGPKGEPRKRDTFRVTSASQRLLEAVAEKYGGKVRPWEGAPEEGYFEVSTEARELDIVLPPVFSSVDGSPTTAYSQWFELWSAGGCQRRCDGQTEMLSGKPCPCAKKVAAQGEEARECKITTRISFILPDIPGLGVWVCESHGWNAAVELPGTLDVLMMAAAEHTFLPAVLRAEPRTKKTNGKTHRFVVPVIDLPGVTVKQLAAGTAPSVFNPPALPSRERPALPPAPAPVGEAFESPEPPHGPPPPLPSQESNPHRTGEGADFQPQNAEDARASESAPSQPGGKIVSAAQVKKLWVTIRERAVPEDEVRKIVVDLTDQDSTKAIPASLFDKVLAAVEAWPEYETAGTPAESPLFPIPESAKAGAR